MDLEIDNVKISIKSPPKKRRGETRNEEDEVTTIVKEVPAVITNEKVIHPEKVVPTLNENTSVGVSSEESSYITINASMIGTFYRSASPENPPFVNVGDSIKEGDAICIIEAMKLFNEIESEISGKIVKVLVDDSTPIEFDQPLFLVDPS